MAALIAFALLNSSLIGAPVLETDHLRSSLVADSSRVSAGQSSQIGLWLEHDADWHTYWLNPGDSGLPTRFDWTLPDGVSIEPLGWPLPTRFDLGELINYGYGGQLLLPWRITLADTFTGEVVEIRLQARWLICHEACLPGRVEYRLTLPIAATPAASEWQSAFAAANARIPRSSAAVAEHQRRAGVIEVRLDAEALPPEAEHWQVLPETAALVDHRQQPRFRREQSSWRLDWPVNDYLATAPQQAAWILLDPQGAWRLPSRLHNPE